MSNFIRIPNIDKYILKYVNGDLIITLKKKYITEDENYITKDENYITKDKNYITKDKNYITKDENYITKDKNYITKDKNYITEDEFNRIILNSSKILECIVKNNEVIISNKLKYRSILDDIWISMPTQKILQTTTFNIKLTNENGNDGYIWCPKLNLSIQNKDAKYTMKEIINMIKINNYSIKITIQLETNLIIKFKLNI